MNHISNKLVPELSVTDFYRSREFYTHILGFSVAYQREEEGFAFLELGEAQIMIDTIGVGRDWTTAEIEYPLGRGMNLQIEVDNVDALYKNLKVHQIPLFLEMEEKWYRTNNKESGNRQFLVQDPDGYLLRFTQDLGERPIRN
jgi:catechol 2,3-dioxygenase-like lactoylglutathione lyase family enzyme